MTYTSPLLQLSGAVEADAPDGGIASHYGNPVAEQRRLEAGTGWVDLSHRDVVRIAGPDRLAYLHAMTTQHFEALAPGVGTDALLLSPQGHIEHAFAGHDDGSAFLAHTEPGAGEALAAFLNRMRFLMRVEASVLTSSLAVVYRPGDGHVVVERSGLGSLVDENGAPAGLWAFEALRIAAGRPRVGLDTDHRTIPNEIGLPGVHLDKGCYRGQETVARVHTLGRPPRRLTMLLLDGSADRLPQRGAVVTVEGRTVGVMGTSSRHHELGPIGLALVKRNVPVELTLDVEGIPAAQEAVVDPEVGLHVRPLLR
uniref:tRNA-modifying protein YgfZ n=1 Tax=uncultured Nocardioidaceae bacterium TaxID=253824 RepID=A0A6J4KN22_9ACTN|nr:MAG: tRNA-modifying protein YgfZ [uncultured Nocardioidaceae bacterium]